MAKQKFGRNNGTGTSLKEKIRAALAAQLVAAQKRGDEATEFQLEVALGK